MIDDVTDTCTHIQPVVNNLHYKPLCFPHNYLFINLFVCLSVCLFINIYNCEKLLMGCKFAFPPNQRKKKSAQIVDLK